MTSAQRQRTVSGPGPSADARTGVLRRMVLLLERAAVLEGRARRCAAPDQVVVLLRRAEHRRREATELRSQLSARGAAVAAGRVERPADSPVRRWPFRPSTAARYRR